MDAKYRIQAWIGNMTAEWLATEVQEVSPTQTIITNYSGGKKVTIYHNSGMLLIEEL